MIKGDYMDFGYGITVDQAGNSYFVGSTYSSNFPIKNKYGSTFGNASDAFIMKYTSKNDLEFS